MGRKRFSPEQIIVKLREAEIIESKGLTQVEAAKWYKLSAEQGDAQSQGNIGVMYYAGQGVALDYIQAYKWLYIAGNKGYEKGRTNRAIIEKLMTPAQISEAQKLARE